MIRIIARHLFGFMRVCVCMCVCLLINCRGVAPFVPFCLRTYIMSNGPADCRKHHPYPTTSLPVTLYTPVRSTNAVLLKKHTTDVIFTFSGNNTPANGNNYSYDKLYGSKQEAITLALTVIELLFSNQPVENTYTRQFTVKVRHDL